MIVSEERVKEFGEVFTPDSIVCDMLDLVDKQYNNISDTEYINRTFLEPTCGDGQFLLRILYNKLLRVSKLPIEERELALVKAVCSVYGIDINEDNVLVARRRLQKLIFGQCIRSFDIKGVSYIQVDTGIKLSSKLKSIIISILENNIQTGNTLDNNLELYEYVFDDDFVSLNKMDIHSDIIYNTSDRVRYTELLDILSDDSESYTF